MRTAITIPDHFKDVDLFQPFHVAGHLFHEFVGANQSAFLAIERHIRHVGAGTDALGDGEHDGHGTGVVVGPRRIRHGVVVRPDQDACLFEVAGADIASFPNDERGTEDSAQFFGDQLLGLGVFRSAENPRERQLLDDFSEVILVKTDGRWQGSWLTVLKLHGGTRKKREASYAIS